MAVAVCCRRCGKPGRGSENKVPIVAAVSLNDAGNPQDLGLYDVLVLFEPSRQLRAEVEFARGNAANPLRELARFLLARDH